MRAKSMSAPTTCAKWATAIAVIVTSPALLIFAVPFGCGMVGDALSAAGTPIAFALTTGICLAALGWARYRGQGQEPQRDVAAAKSLG